MHAFRTAFTSYQATTLVGINFTCSYKLKFGVIVLLPLSLLACLALITLLTAAWKRCVLRQSKRLAWSHNHASIAAGSILMYLFYLYVTRTSLDTLNCVPTTPPTYDANGNLITYMAVVFEECSTPGGTFHTLLPWAIITLMLYSFGYPLFMGTMLWRNRYCIMQDQLLRAKGMGDSKLENPEAYVTRQRWHRSYYTFKPDAYWWMLAVLARKFGIAVTAIIFNRNAAFQLVACMMVMFLAYVAQVRVSPYMSPSEHEEVLRDHVTASFTSPMHARLAAALWAVQQRGKKRTRRNLLTADGKLDRVALASALATWLYNYNTAEAVLLFSTVIVLMMALMYLASSTGSGAAYYGDAQDAITGVVMAVIAISLLYIVALIVTEVWVGWAAATAEQRKRSGRPSTLATSKGRKSMMPVGAEFNAGNVESNTNPMHWSGSDVREGGEDRTSSIDGSVLADMLSQDDAPSSAVWLRLKGQLAMQHAKTASRLHRLEETEAELVEARRQLDAMTEGPMPGARLSMPRIQFKPRQSAEPDAYGAATSSRHVGKGGSSRLLLAQYQSAALSLKARKGTAPPPPPPKTSSLKVSGSDPV